MTDGPEISAQALRVDQSAELVGDLKDLLSVKQRELRTGKQLKPVV